MKFRKFRMKFRNEISLLKLMINNFISNRTETDNHTTTDTSNKNNNILAK